MNGNDVIEYEEKNTERLRDDFIETNYRAYMKFVEQEYIESTMQ